MYTPKHFEVSDRKLLLSFMKQYHFALMVTSASDFPTGTHLPFLIEERGDDIFLISHMAKANEQWKDFNHHRKTMVVFSEPHAYISTSFYDAGNQVPTWNYVAIHAYGNPVILNSDEVKINILEKMIAAFHAPDLADFHALEPKYLAKMLNAIVAFEIKIDDLQGKFKMSQNRKQNEKENIANAFEKSNESMIREVGALIKKANNIT
jgi:transcriptional regulator